MNEETGAGRGERGEDDGGGAAIGGMGRGDKIMIAVLVALGVVLLAGIFVLALLRSPEWMQVVLAVGLFAALGLGAYRYVITPSGRRQESGSE
ncbi:MAG: hypothetical protein M3Q49_10640 [Actinomycetota bacterium]|nr:hypothetical protein [Actinomycetota bacterium]